MLLLKRFARIFLVFLLSSPSLIWADELTDQLLNTVTLDGDINGRTPTDFNKDADNVTALVTKNTKAKVLEVRRLDDRHHSFGVKLRIESVGKNGGKNTAQPGDEVWVYYSKKVPWLNFKNKEGKSVANPFEALTAKASKEGLSVKASTIEAKTKEKESHKTEGGHKTVCDDCAVPAIKDLANIGKVLNENHAWDEDPLVGPYVRSEKVAKLIDAAIASPWGADHCYRAVKDLLIAGDIIDIKPKSRYARDAVTDLKKKGLINLLDSPSFKHFIKSPGDAPPGAILVYSKQGEPGHIEVKTGRNDINAYVSFYKSPHSIFQTRKGLAAAKTKSPYKLIGVMILPPDKV
ncbi:MAG TPA: hypothetical protein VN132_15445 [Bdellovibrio sp.]|nr:hypothetical protein [Bdellovibrio sp.]